MPRYGDIGEQYFISPGVPDAGGELEFLDSSGNEIITYYDPDYTIPNTNPVILDAAGRQPDIWIPDELGYDCAAYADALEALEPFGFWKMNDPSTTGNAGDPLLTDGVVAATLGTDMVATSAIPDANYPSLVPDDCDGLSLIVSPGGPGGTLSLGDQPDYSDLTYGCVFQVMHSTSAVFNILLLDYWWHVSQTGDGRIHISESINGISVTWYTQALSFVTETVTFSPALTTGKVYTILINVTTLGVDVYVDFALYGSVLWGANPPEPLTGDRTGFRSLFNSCRARVQNFAFIETPFTTEQIEGLELAFDRTDSSYVTPTTTHS